MQSQDKYRIAVLAAYAIALHAFEGLLPKPIPWLRLGLANIITLVTLLLYGMRAALMVTLIRVLVASLITGTFLGPTFIMSLGGGVTSAFAMGAVFLLIPKLFGPVGLSLIGALFHNTAQLLLAYVLFIQRIEAILLVSPFVVLMGTLTGAVNGIISAILIKNLKKKEEKIQNS